MASSSAEPKKRKASGRIGSDDEEVKKKTELKKRKGKQKIGEDGDEEEVVGSEIDGKAKGVGRKKANKAINISLRGSASKIHKLLNEMSPKSRDKFSKCCFGHLIDLPPFTVNRTLMCAVLRRYAKWDMFDFDGYDVRCSLKDIALITGLSVTPLVNPIRYDEGEPRGRLKNRYLGTSLVDEYKLLKAIQKLDSNQENQEEEEEDLLKMHMLYFICVFLLPNSAKNLDPKWIQLAENFSRFNAHPWGFEVHRLLVESFRHMFPKLCSPHFNAYGCLHVFTVWCYMHLPSVAPPCVDHVYPRLLAYQHRSRLQNKGGVGNTTLKTYETKVDKCLKKNNLVVEVDVSLEEQQAYEQTSSHRLPTQEEDPVRGSDPQRPPKHSAAIGSSRSSDNQLSKEDLEEILEDIIEERVGGPIRQLNRNLQGGSKHGPSVSSDLAPAAKKRKSVAATEQSPTDLDGDPSATKKRKRGGKRKKNATSGRSPPRHADVGLSRRSPRIGAAGSPSPQKPAPLNNTTPRSSSAVAQEEEHEHAVGGLRKSPRGLAARLQENDGVEENDGVLPSSQNLEKGSGSQNLDEGKLPRENTSEEEEHGSVGDPPVSPGQHAVGGLRRSPRRHAARLQENDGVAAELPSSQNPEKGSRSQNLKEGTLPRENTQPAVAVGKVDVHGRSPGRRAEEGLRRNPRRHAAPLQLNDGVAPGLPSSQNPEKAPGSQNLKEGTLPRENTQQDEELGGVDVPARSPLNHGGEETDGAAADLPSSQNREQEEEHGNVIDLAKRGTLLTVQSTTKTPTGSRSAKARTKKKLNVKQKRKEELARRKGLAKSAKADCAIGKWGESLATYQRRKRKQSKGSLPATEGNDDHATEGEDEQEMKNMGPELENAVLQYLHEHHVEASFYVLHETLDMVVTDVRHTPLRRRKTTVKVLLGVLKYLDEVDANDHEPFVHLDRNLDKCQEGKSEAVLKISPAIVASLKPDRWVNGWVIKWYTTRYNRLVLSHHPVPHATLVDNEFLLHLKSDYARHIFNMVDKSNKNPGYSAKSPEEQLKIAKDGKGWMTQLENWDGEGTLVIPHHCRSQHWNVLQVLPAQRKIVIFDSMGRRTTPRKTLEMSKPTLEALRGMLNLFIAAKFPMNSQNELWDMVVDLDVPKQTNGDDCGIFSLMYLDLLCRNCACNVPVGAAEIRKMRYLLASELLTDVGVL